jgi:hypothetical protein
MSRPSPHPAERSFLERAQTLREREVETTVAVLPNASGKTT